MLESLKILTWNCNSLKPHRKSLIEDFAFCENVDIISLNEARQSMPKVLKNYHMVEASVDLHVFIHRSLDVQFVITTNFHHAECDVIILRLSSVYLCFAYLRNGSSRVGIDLLLLKVKSACPSGARICIIGDLNAKSCFLPNLVTNLAGRVLDSFIRSDDDYLIVNEKVPTFFRQNRNSSTLDLCIVTDSLVSNMRHCSTLNVFDSDHKPVMIQFDFHHGPAVLMFPDESYYQDMFPVRAANIRNIPDKFEELLADELTSVSKCPPTNCEEIWFYLEKSIISVFKKLKLIRKKSSFIRKPWFTPEIRELISISNQEKSTASALAVKKAIRYAKDNMWNSFVESIHYSDSQRELWVKFQCSRGRPVIPLISGDLLVRANELASKFKSYSVPNIPIHPDDSAMFNQNLSPIDLSIDDGAECNMPISSAEVEFAIDCSRESSAPGPDGIGYSVFKKFPESGIQLLTSLYNSCFDSGVFPESFHRALVMALPKSTPGDFRPITLSNSVVKILDRILYRRLVKMIDPLLPDWQYGFRVKRGASDQLLRFHSTIQKYHDKGLHVGVLFLDITKAFDRVCRKRLLLDLYSQGVRGKCLQAIFNLLSLKSIQIIQERVVSDPFTPEEGTPQGGVCSPLLWNFFFRGASRAIDEQYRRLPSFLKGICPPEMFGFADDAALLVVGKSKSQVFNLLSEAYSRIRKFCYRSRIELNGSKVKSLHISPKRNKRLRDDVQEAVKSFDMDGHPIVVEEVKEYKYLGAIIDSKLSMKPWLTRIREHIFTRIQFIRRLAACGKLGRAKMEKLYQGYVRGFMNYGCLVWSHGPKKQVEMILAADRNGLRMCTGALLRTSNLSLLAESTIEDYSITLNRMGLLYSLKLLCTPELASVRVLAEDSRSNCSASKIFKLWIDSNLPTDTQDYLHLKNRIMTLLPRRKVQNKKYWKTWHLERFLSRVRMKILPTKVWAKSMKLESSDSCRHCKAFPETLDHLFGTCPSIDYSFFSSTFEQILFDCSDFESSHYRSQMRVLARFVKESSLFRLYNPNC